MLPVLDFFHTIIDHFRTGRPAGIYSACTANRWAILACMRQGLAIEQPLLLEATCNQVNQFGGYSGLTPAEFATFAFDIAQQIGFPAERLFLGGDHLGPSPWQSEPAEIAMVKSLELVHAYASAGYAKLHLDASMTLGDDPVGPLATHTAARRAAELCRAAEEAARQAGRPAPVYIIGTEVPVPGGVQGKEDKIHITQPVDAQATLEYHREAFLRNGLESAWERVVGLVVQPGVEFGEDQIFPYQREEARPLSDWLRQGPELVFEAHSTDYQPAGRLQEMVADGFAILKVGPALTFAFREAVLALAQIEEEWLSGRTGPPLSGLAGALEAAMQADPTYWRKYYRGDVFQQALARRYSFSDRARYYWPVPVVQRALDRLLENLGAHPAPPGLLSQYLPAEYRAVNAGTLVAEPGELILYHIQRVAQDYCSACFPENA